MDVDLNVVLKERKAVWRRRGPAPRHIPDHVFGLLYATYNTGKVGTIALDATGDLDPDGRELLALLRQGAERRGKRVRIQNDGTELRFEMADKGTRRKAAAK
jgi:hypothetical protein